VKAGDLVHDHALGMNGIIVSEQWIEARTGRRNRQRNITWEWCVLFEDGEPTGADTSDLRMISGAR